MRYQGVMHIVRVVLYGPDVANRRRNEALSSPSSDADDADEVLPAAATAAEAYELADAARKAARRAEVGLSRLRSQLASSIPGSPSVDDGSDPGGGDGIPGARVASNGPTAHTAGTLRAGASIPGYSLRKARGG